MRRVRRAVLVVLLWVAAVVPGIAGANVQIVDIRGCPPAYWYSSGNAMLFLTSVSLMSPTGPCTYQGNNSTGTHYTQVLNNATSIESLQIDMGPTTDITPIVTEVQNSREVLNQTITYAGIVVFFLFGVFFGWWMFGPKHTAIIGEA